MKQIVIALAVAGAAWSNDTQTAAPAVQTIEYEAFCKLPDTEAKRSAFVRTSPENRAVLVRTQLERWRDANRARLNAKQLAGMAELIASITSDTYAEGPKGEEARVKARAVGEAQQQLFTRDELQAMQPYGPCIAKIKAQ